MTENINDIVKGTAAVKSKSRKAMYERSKVNLTAEWAARNLNIHSNPQFQK